MAQHDENRPIDGAVELLKTNGFDGLAEAVTVLLNSAMVSPSAGSLVERFAITSMISCGINKLNAQPNQI